MLAQYIAVPCFSVIWVLRQGTGCSLPLLELNWAADLLWRTISKFVIVLQEFHTCYVIFSPGLWANIGHHCFASRCQGLHEAVDFPLGMYFNWTSYLCFSFWPKIAQNNVGFFLLPNATIYWDVLWWRKKFKKFKNEILNWLSVLRPPSFFGFSRHSEWDGQSKNVSIMSGIKFWWFSFF